MPVTAYDAHRGRNREIIARAMWEYFVEGAGWGSDWEDVGPSERNDAYERADEVLAKLAEPVGPDTDKTRNP